ncbi:MAG TPA: 4-hydroxythreonine-4-phosphate dehydrogenase PdxA [Chitinophagales bacterium]|nr:4-hydroxythreonine-4-phosphate dehydrogenase PdxA [Chitinophagales bacterium]
MSDHKKYLVGITLGDMNGIGLEVMLKTFLDNRMYEWCTPVLYGSSKIVSFHRKVLNLGQFNFAQSRGVDKIQLNTFNIINCWEDDPVVQLGQMNETGGKYAFLSIEAAVKDLKEGKIDALVTAPINKKNILRENFQFAGHTGYLAQQAGVSDYCMFLCSNDLRVGLVTEHVPVSEIAQSIKKEKIISKLDIIRKSLKLDFGIDKPKIAVLSLNPHAGDDGLIGKEEMDEIRPAIAEAKAKNIFALGPYPADGLFGSGNYKKFDAILAMYHDQGLVPFKALCFDSGVNYTAGLPFVRTSPDHGTGYDIAGKNLAREDSFREAVFLAVDILKKRENLKDMSANPLKKTEMAKERG